MPPSTDTAGCRATGPAAIPRTACAEGSRWTHAASDPAVAVSLHAWSIRRLSDLKIILFGASGMVGAGALREALDAPEVETVLSVGRRPSGVTHPKLRELFLPNLFDFAAVE